MSIPVETVLPESLEVKAQLLRARIADVPIDLPDLAKAADESEFADNVVCGYLSRPLSWARDPSETLEWFLYAVSTLTAQSQPQRVALLLHAGSYGLGAAVDPSQRSSADRRHYSLAPSGESPTPVSSQCCSRAAASPPPTSTPPTSQIHCTTPCSIY